MEDSASTTTPPDSSDAAESLEGASGMPERKKASEQEDPDPITTTPPESPSDSLDPLEPPGTPEGMAVSEHEDSAITTPPDCSNVLDPLEAREMIERMETSSSPDIDTVVPPESPDPVVPSKSNLMDATEPPDHSDPLEPSDPPKDTAEPSDPLEMSDPPEDTAEPSDPSDSLKPSDADPLEPSKPSGRKKKKGRGRPSGLAWYGKKGKDAVINTISRKTGRKPGRPFGSYTKSTNSDKPGPVSGGKRTRRKKKRPGRKPAMPPKILSNKKISTERTSELPYQIIVPPYPPSQKAKSGVPSGKPYQIIVPSYRSGPLQKNMPLNNSPPPKPLPPKPNPNLKICLICLRRYDDSEKCTSSEPQEEIEVIEVIDKTPSQDPLLDAVVKANFTSAMKVKEMERKAKRLNVYFRFLKIVSRYLQIKTKRFRKSVEKDDNPPFCNDCFHFVENFCDVYGEWDVAKISIRWRLTQIAEAVKLSKSGKLGTSLLKSLSTQLHLINARAVDHFRKQLSIKCSVIAKTVVDGPRVWVDKNGCKKYAESQLKFPIEQMVGYLKSLIVVFALAVPHKEVVKPKIKSHKKGTKSVTKTKTSPVEVKVEMTEGQEATTDNIDHDHFGGGDDGGGCSPPPSPGGPSSPVGAEEGEEDDKQDNDNDEEDGLRGSDTDWSGNDSNVEFSVKPTITRRWNLRKRRCTRKADEENDPKDADNDDDFALELPPLRSARPKHVVNEEDKKYPCNICNLRFFTDGALKRHLGQKHEFILPYNCKHCPQRFKMRKFLDIHMKKAHPAMKSDNSLSAITSTCSSCQKVFPSKTKLIIHRRQAHKANLGKFTCETCGRVVRGKFRYDRHVNTHITERPFPCTHPSCRRSFFKEDALKSHLTFHAENPDWQPATASRKRKQGVRSKNIKFNHGPYKCEVPDCGRGFYKESNLTTHMTLHAASFTCSTCEKVFFSVPDIRSHLIREHETTRKVHHCPFCDKGFTLTQTHELHIKTAHPSQTKFACDVDVCEDEFDTVDDLREHLKTAHLPPEVVEVVEKLDGGGIFFCLSKKTKNSEETEVNSTIANIAPSDGSVTTSTETNPVSAPDPTATDPPSSEGDSAAAAAVTDAISVDVTSKIRAIVTQLKIDGPEIFAPGLFTCEKCRWSFSTRFALSIHLILHTKRDPQGQFGCKLCPKSFRVVDTLQTHYNSEHGPNIKRILCKICGQRFHRKESYIGHMKMHQEDSSEDKSYLCSDCGMACENRFAYHQHMRTHKNKGKGSSASRSPKEPSQPNRRRIPGVAKAIRGKRSPRSGPRVFQCDQCAETFPNKLKLAVHESNVHGKEKPLKCDKEGCSRSFFSTQALKFHLATHGEPGFLCPMCPRTFHRKQHFDDHVTVHKQEKNHVCHVCGKGFYLPKSLKLHLDIHSDVKNYKCSYCDKAFVRKSVLICHERTHTKERPFACRMCGETFSQYSARKQHENRHKRLNSDQKLPMRGRGRREPEESENKAKEPPIRESKRKGKNKERCKKSESSDEEPVPASSASGIIHEALKAAFSDGSEIPHFGDVFNSKAEVKPGVGKQDLLNSIEVVVQYNDNNDATENNSEEGDVSQQGRKRKGRPPKSQEKKTSYTSDLTCGFCGKVFQRQRAYTAHVEQHLNVDSVLGGGSSNGTQMGKKRNQQSHTNTSLVNNQQQHHHPPTPEPARVGLSTLTRRQSRLAALAVAPSPPQPVVEPEPPSKKRKGRPPGKGNKSKSEPPGKRLARIVEDVMEAATSAQYFNNTRTSTPPQTQSPAQLYQQHSTHQVMQSPSPHQQHLYQSSPSPHQAMQSGSERSTPTMSPAPNQNHHQAQESSQQQAGMFLNQQGANAHTQQHQNQQQPQQNLHSNYAQYQYLLHNQNSGGNATLPQDLSKSSYPMFFANPR